MFILSLLLVPFTVLVTAYHFVTPAGCQQRGPLSPRSRCHCPQSHGKAGLPQPLPTGLAVQGRYLSYIFRPSAHENLLYHLFINGNLGASMPASYSVSQLLAVGRKNSAKTVDRRGNWVTGGVPSVTICLSALMEETIICIIGPASGRTQASVWKPSNPFKGGIRGALTRMDRCVCSVCAGGGAGGMAIAC